MNEQRILYPSPSPFTFILPTGWSNESNERLLLISPDKACDISGTVFNREGATLEAFTQHKHDALQKQMSWYKPVTKIKKCDHQTLECYQRCFEGVWPEEDQPTYYEVLTIRWNDYYLSLTCTYLTKDQDKFKPIFHEFLNQMQITPIHKKTF